MEAKDTKDVDMAERAEGVAKIHVLSDRDMTLLASLSEWSEKITKTPAPSDRDVALVASLYKWAEKFGSHIPFDKNAAIDKLEKSCVNGNLKAAKDAYVEGGLSAEDIVSIKFVTALDAAVNKGHLPVVSWLLDTFEPSSTYLDIMTLMNTTARNGDIAIAKKLVAYSVPNVRTAAGCEILRVACRNNHICYASWLCDAFELKSDDYYGTVIGYGVFTQICMDGNLSMAVWIIDQFGEPDSKTILYTLKQCCKTGKLDVVNYLCDRFEISHAEIRARNNIYVWHAVKNKHYSLAQKLITEFKLSQKEVEDTVCYKTFDTFGCTDINCENCAIARSFSFTEK